MLVMVSFYLLYNVYKDVNLIEILKINFFVNLYNFKIIYPVINHLFS